MRRACAQYLDEEVRTCSKETWFYPPGPDDQDCYDAVVRSACYLIFPKCTSVTEPLPICSSTCENQGILCRETGSTFGPVEDVEKNCGGGCSRLARRP